MFTLKPIKSILTSSSCHYPSCDLILYGEGEIRGKFTNGDQILVRPGTNKTSFKVREEVGKVVPVWDIGRDAPLPTIT